MDPPDPSATPNDILIELSRAVSEATVTSTTNNVVIVDNVSDLCSSTATVTNKSSGLEEVEKLREKIMQLEQRNSELEMKLKTNTDNNNNSSLNDSTSSVNNCLDGSLSSTTLANINQGGFIITTNGIAYVAPKTTSGNNVLGPVVSTPSTSAIASSASAAASSSLDLLSSSNSIINPSATSNFDDLMILNQNTVSTNSPLISPNSKTSQPQAFIVSKRQILPVITTPNTTNSSSAVNTSNPVTTAAPVVLVKAAASAAIKPPAIQPKPTLIIAPSPATTSVAPLLLPKPTSNRGGARTSLTNNVTAKSKTKRSLSTGKKTSSTNLLAPKPSTSPNKLVVSKSGNDLAVSSVVITESTDSSSITSSLAAASSILPGGKKVREIRPKPPSSSSSMLSVASHHTPAKIQPAPAVQPAYVTISNHQTSYMSKLGNTMIVEANDILSKAVSMSFSPSSELSAATTAASTVTNMNSLSPVSTNAVLTSTPATTGQLFSTSTNLLQAIQAAKSSNNGTNPKVPIQRNPKSTTTSQNKASQKAKTVNGATGVGEKNADSSNLLMPISSTNELIKIAPNTSPQKQHLPALKAKTKTFPTLAPKLPATPTKTNGTTSFFQSNTTVHSQPVTQLGIIDLQKLNESFMEWTTAAANATTTTTTTSTDLASLGLHQPIFQLEQTTSASVGSAILNIDNNMLHTLTNGILETSPIIITPAPNTQSCNTATSSIEDSIEAAISKIVNSGEESEAQSKQQQVIVIVKNEEEKKNVIISPAKPSDKVVKKEHATPPTSDPTVTLSMPSLDQFFEFDNSSTNTSTSNSPVKQQQQQTDQIKKSSSPVKKILPLIAPAIAPKPVPTTTPVSTAVASLPAAKLKKKGKQVKQVKPEPELSPHGTPLPTVRSDSVNRPNESKENQPNRLQLPEKIHFQRSDMDKVIDHMLDHLESKDTPTDVLLANESITNTANNNPLQTLMDEDKANTSMFMEMNLIGGKLPNEDSPSVLSTPASILPKKSVSTHLAASSVPQSTPIKSTGLKSGKKSQNLLNSSTLDSENLLFSMLNNSIDKQVIKRRGRPPKSAAISSLAQSTTGEQSKKLDLSDQKKNEPEEEKDTEDFSNFVYDIAVSDEDEKSDKMNEKQSSNKLDLDTSDLNQILNLNQNDDDLDQSINNKSQITITSLQAQQLQQAKRKRQANNAATSSGANKTKGKENLNKAQQTGANKKETVKASKEESKREIKLEEDDESTVNANKRVKYSKKDQPKSASSSEKENKNEEEDSERDESEDENEIQKAKKTSKGRGRPRKTTTTTTTSKQTKKTAGKTKQTQSASKSNNKSELAGITRFEIPYDEEENDEANRKKSYLSDESTLNGDDECSSTKKVKLNQNENGDETRGEGVDNEVKEDEEDDSGKQQRVNDYEENSYDSTAYMNSSDAHLMNMLHIQAPGAPRPPPRLDEEEIDEEEMIAEQNLANNNEASNQLDEQVQEQQAIEILANEMSDTSSSSSESEDEDDENQGLNDHDMTNNYMKSNVHHLNLNKSHNATMSNHYDLENDPILNNDLQQIRQTLQESEDVSSSSAALNSNNMMASSSSSMKHPVILTPPSTVSNASTNSSSGNNLNNNMSQQLSINPSSTNSTSSNQLISPVEITNPSVNPIRSTSVDPYSSTAPATNTVNYSNNYTNSPSYFNTNSSPNSNNYASNQSNNPNITITNSNTNPVGNSSNNNRLSGGPSFDQQQQSNRHSLSSSSSSSSLHNTAANNNQGSSSTSNTTSNYNSSNSSSNLTRSKSSSNTTAEFYNNNTDVYSTSQQQQAAYSQYHLMNNMYNTNPYMVPPPPPSVYNNKTPVYPGTDAMSRPNGASTTFGVNQYGNYNNQRFDTSNQFPSANTAAASANQFNSAAAVAAAAAASSIQSYLQPDHLLAMRFANHFNSSSIPFNNPAGTYTTGSNTNNMSSGFNQHFDTNKSKKPTNTSSSSSSNKSETKKTTSSNGASKKESKKSSVANVPNVSVNPVGVNGPGTKLPAAPAPQYNPLEAVAALYYSTSTAAGYTNPAASIMNNPAVNGSYVNPYTRKTTSYDLPTSTSSYNPKFDPVSPAHSTHQSSTTPAGSIPFFDTNRSYATSTSYDQTSRRGYSNQPTSQPQPQQQTQSQHQAAYRNQNQTTSQQPYGAVTSNSTDTLMNYNRTLSMAAAYHSAQTYHHHVAQHQQHQQQQHQSQSAMLAAAALNAAAYQQPSVQSATTTSHHHSQQASSHQPPSSHHNQHAVAAAAAAHQQMNSYFANHQFNWPSTL